MPFMERTCLQGHRWHCTCCVLCAGLSVDMLERMHLSSRLKVWGEEDEGGAYPEAHGTLVLVCWRLGHSAARAAADGPQCSQEPLWRSLHYEHRPFSGGNPRSEDDETAGAGGGVRP